MWEVYACLSVQHLSVGVGQIPLEVCVCPSVGHLLKRVGQMCVCPSVGHLLKRVGQMCVCLTMGHLLEGAGQMPLEVHVCPSVTHLLEGVGQMPLEVYVCLSVADLLEGVGQMPCVCPSVPHLSEGAGLSATPVWLCSAVEVQHWQRECDWVVPHLADWASQSLEVLRSEECGPWEAAAESCLKGVPVIWAVLTTQFE